MADFVRLNHQGQAKPTVSASLHPSSVGVTEQLPEDGDRKRGMNKEQLRTLERWFMLEKKLLPERKMYLAQALGLPPRQIAVWFQNRRARWKTKQLEKEYELLKRRYGALMAEQDALKAQNQRLHAMLLSLRAWQQPKKPINPKRETEDFCVDSKHTDRMIHQSRGCFQEAMPLQLQLQGAKMDQMDESSTFFNNFFSSIDVEGGSMLWLDQPN